jgi:predicted nucleotidyltransferase
MIELSLPSIAEETDDFKRKLLFLCWLRNELKKDNVEFVVVGGSAVELYSFGKYLSGDIDIVSPASSRIGEKLENLGFVKHGKNWISKELRLFLEIPASTLAGDPSRVREVEISEGLSVTIIGVEDLIVDRLNACVHWKYETDCEWASYLIRKFENEIDSDYLKERSIKEQVDAKLTELRSK